MKPEGTSRIKRPGHTVSTTKIFDTIVTLLIILKKAAYQMLNTYKRTIASQYEATFCTLHLCVKKCPEPLWQEPVANNPYSQTAFHTLFFADLYLGKNVPKQNQQEFHELHADTFGDYEQLQDRRPVDRYEKEFINDYLTHCRQKASKIVAAESTDQLNELVEFPGWILWRALNYTFTI